MSSCGFLRWSVVFARRAQLLSTLSRSWMWKDRASGKCPSARAPFSWIGRASSFLTNRLGRQNWNKNKFSISTYTFDFTKLQGAQLCVRWCIDPYRWQGQFNILWENRYVTLTPNEIFKNFLPCLQLLSWINTLSSHRSVLKRFTS